MALMMLLKKRPKKSVVPPSGNIKKHINIPAKKHGAPSAHTIMCLQKEQQQSKTYTRVVRGGRGVKMYHHSQPWPEFTETVEVKEALEDTDAIECFRYPARHFKTNPTETVRSLLG
jgi:hypothetical protein